MGISNPIIQLFHGLSRNSKFGRLSWLYSTSEERPVAGESGSIIGAVLKQDLALIFEQYQCQRAD